MVRGLLAVQRIVDQWFSGILQQILNEFGNREMHCHHYPQKNPWASSSASREAWKTVLSLVGTFVTDLLGFSLFCPLFKAMQGSLSHSSCPLVSEFPENAHLQVESCIESWIQFLIVCQASRKGHLDPVVIGVGHNDLVVLGNCHPTWLCELTLQDTELPKLAMVDHFLTPYLRLGRIDYGS